MRLFSRVSSRSAFALSLVVLGLLAWPASSVLGQDAGGPPKGEGRPDRGDRPPRGEGRPDRARREAPSVEQAMNGVERALQQLSEHISDPSKKEDNLRFIGEAQRALIAAKLQPPPPKALERATDEAERVKMTEDFRRRLMRVLRKLVDMEEQVLDGKLAEAAKGLEEVIKERDEAHGVFGVSE